MGFLKGVLESVKTDDAVTTYDKYITADDKKLKSVLELLNKQIGTGRAGLAASVEQVKRWLEGYEREVNKKCEVVMRTLSDYALQMDARKAYIATIPNSTLDKVNTYYMRYVEGAVTILSDLKKNDNGYKGLDKELKEKLRVPLVKVEGVIESMKRTCENTKLNKQIREVDRTFRDERTAVENKIAEMASAVKKTLNEQFHTISTKISDIEDLQTYKLKALLTSFSELKRSLTAADVAATTLDTAYDEEIIEQLRKLDGKANELDTNEISKDLQQVYDATNKQLLKLSSDLSALKHLYMQVGRNVDSGANKMEAALTEKIGALKADVKTKIKGYVESTLPGRITEVLMPMTNVIARLDPKNGDPGYLDNIFYGVEKYAKCFTVQQFDGVLKVWITHILENNVTVKELLDGYVENNRHQLTGKLRENDDGFNPGTITEIANKISSQLKQKIGAAFPSAGDTDITSADDTESVKVNLQHASSSIQKFASELGRKLKQDEIDKGDTVAKQLAKEVETSLLVTGGVIPSIDIEEAVRYTLAALVSVAKHAGEELKRLIDTSDISSNLLAAKHRIVHLGDYLSSEIINRVGTLGNLGRTINESLGEQASNVEFKTPINELLKQAVSQGISMLNDEMNSFINTQLSDIDGDIRQQINRMQHIPSSTSGEIQENIINLQKQIESVQDAVSATKGKAEGTIKKQVGNLKVVLAVMRKMIESIDRDVQSFDEELSNDLEAAKLAINQSRLKVEAEISKFLKEVTQTSQKAFDGVYTKVNDMFAERQKADLSVLQDIVQSQNDVITTIIDEDKTSGLKGLLSEMYKYKGSNIKELQLKGVNESERFEKLSDKFNAYFTLIFRYITAQVKTTSKSPSAASTNEETKLLSNVQGAIGTLFKNLSTKKHFDKVFVDDLQSLLNALTKFIPSHFAGSPNPKLLDVIKKGLKDLYEQLDRAYVSCYSGGNWNKDSDKYTRIVITITPMLHDYLQAVHRRCNDKNFWKFNRINMKTEMGQHFELCGYSVSKNDNSYEGELRNSSDFTGLTIPGLREFFKADDSGLLEILIRHVRHYLEACHLKMPSAPKHPCTVRDMLCWIAGVPYSPVYPKIRVHCTVLLDRKGADGTPNKEDDVLKECIETIPIDLTLVSHECRNVLITICGNGHGFAQADYPYACNFVDNSLGFHYPSDVPSLLDMLTDMCGRILRALNFMRTRCRYGASVGNGWADCSYGRYVPRYQWHCNDHSSDQPNCQPKSPLQSHLMDALPGCQPHKLTSVGCKYLCSTCPKGLQGQACLTPMGFWDLYSAASITKKGSDIHGVLSDLCKDAESPLCSLLRSLQFISPYPPKDLGDMFSFYCNFMQCRRLNGTYNRTIYSDNTQFKKTLDDVTVPNCLPLPFPESLHNNYLGTTFTGALSALYNDASDHSGAQSDEITHSDLASLTVRSRCTKSINCAPYIQPLCFHAYHSYPHKHASLYFSWIVHLTWVFWEWLEHLLKSFQVISCKNFGCASCNCKTNTHGDKHACRCISVVECGGGVSTLYQYGLTFGNTSTLQNAKKCGMFCSQLKNVMQSKHFSELFEAIDSFIWAIRTPFLYLIVALWLLSLLYLLHIMVIRLDLLHIKSHLHSPSSHRIAAQSLLAAGRVNKLGRVFYLQP